MKVLFVLITSMILLASCSSSRNIAKSAKQEVINDKALANAHVGICIYEPATGKYLYNYQGDKYFVPASNTKIPTCYAAMKYLGDSLVGALITEYEYDLFIGGTGDPSFLHPDFKQQPVFDFLKSLDTLHKNVWLREGRMNAKQWGPAWSWSDYEEDYMAERSRFPIYGNLVHFSGRQDSLKVIPSYFSDQVSFFHKSDTYISRIERPLGHNEFTVWGSGETPRTVDMPFITSDSLLYRLLLDTLHLKRRIIPPGSMPPVLETTPRTYEIYSQPTDSVLKPMMHRSDNFFAEQSLLMVSRKKLGGLISDGKIIDTLLKTDFKNLPQKPYWVDGSGLSRFNLFSPQDMVTILNKMQTEFGMERIKTIFATGGEGTLRSYYKDLQGLIYAKTGTLTGVVALSGFLYTKKNKLLIFSVLVNNHNSSATQVRRAVEKFINELRNNN